MKLTTEKKKSDVVGSGELQPTHISLNFITQARRKRGGRWRGGDGARFLLNAIFYESKEIVLSEK